jgi:hypothetical protein
LLAGQFNPGDEEELQRELALLMGEDVPDSSSVQRNISSQPPKLDLPAVPSNPILSLPQVPDHTPTLEQTNQQQNELVTS